MGDITELTPLAKGLAAARQLARMLLSVQGVRVSECARNPPVLGSAFPARGSSLAPCIRGSIDLGGVVVPYPYTIDNTNKNR